MKIFYYFSIAVFGLAFIVSDVDARSKRVNQIPNGNINRCANCHIDPNGGGPRNAFGSTVGASYLDGNGDVIWNASLAQKDSDNDGATNGQELQDPDGTWTIGQANPGDASLVSNPGDPNSTTKVELVNGALPEIFALGQNYPNPFNPTTTITFSIAKPENVTLRIYNSQGQAVRTLTNEFLNPGHYQVAWDGSDDSGRQLSSGIYLYRLQAGNLRQLKRMIFVK